MSVPRKYSRYLIPWELDDGTWVDLANKDIQPFKDAIWDAHLGRWFSGADLALFSRMDEFESMLKKKEVEALEINRRAFDEVLARMVLKHASQYPPSEVKKAHEVLGI